MMDYNSGRNIDMQGLMKVADASERRHAFDMASWCGTSCCMIGSFCAENEDDDLFMDQCHREPRFAPDYIGTVYEHDEYGTPANDSPSEAIAKRFGLSVREVDFLFTSGHLSGRQIDTVFSWQRAKDATDMGKPEALRRLRKLIYYKMRKSELMAPANRDTLRKAERRPDHHLKNPQTVRKISELCA